MMLKRLSISAPDRLAVGSSMTTMRAFLYSALAISTACCSAGPKCGNDASRIEVEAEVGKDLLRAAKETLPLHDGKRGDGNVAKEDVFPDAQVRDKVTLLVDRDDAQRLRDARGKGSDRNVVDAYLTAVRRARRRGS